MVTNPSVSHGLTKLPGIVDPRGKLVFMEGERHVPFLIRRFFVLYETQQGCERGGHAHLACHQFLLVLSGTFTAELNDGSRHWRQVLSDPTGGLYVRPMTWLVLSGFSANAVCGVLASEQYDEADYIRDFRKFTAMVAENEQ